ncbi:ubulin-tyrosine ligase [Thraustotheca clavata]|uniref:Ubulin-tyrosine ligase n=1 Tax=Thraustotheca clavata TaxID=74557 RepID=A0A1V9ZYW1_9STRA|nr:ubulin-tyrosine ligase [Thraustotheca clavata]
MSTYSTFLAQHEAQLRGANVPQHLWPSLFQKLCQEIFDAGNYFQLARDQDGDLHAVAIQDLDASNRDAIFLIDHAWTFTNENSNARNTLKNVPSLLPRMENLMQLSGEGDVETRTNAVLQSVWKFANSYRLGHLPAEEAGTIWYIMDEFGSAIEHEDEPNFCMAPFYYVSGQCAFSIMWPIQDIENGDFVSRSYVSATTEDVRIALCAALFYPKGEEYNEQIDEICTRRRLQASNIMDAQYNRDEESVPNTIASKKAIELTLPVKICTDLKYMKEFVDHPNFVFVDNENDANVVWPTRHIKDYVSLHNNPNV